MPLSLHIFLDCLSQNSQEIPDSCQHSVNEVWAIKNSQASNSGGPSTCGKRWRRNRPGKFLVRTPVRRKVNYQDPDQLLLQKAGFLKQLKAKDSQLVLNKKKLLTAHSKKFTTKQSLKQEMNREKTWGVNCRKRDKNNWNGR